jgi:hypothetical protein
MSHSQPNRFKVKALAATAVHKIAVDDPRRDLAPLAFDSTRAGTVHGWHPVSLRASQCQLAARASVSLARA